MSEEIMDQIKSEVEGNKVVLFMKGTPDAPQCGFSSATVEVVKGYGYPFKGIDVLANPEFRANLPKYSDWPTFPQLFVDGKLVGGCDIVLEMRDSGDLKKVLDQAHQS